MEMVIRCNGNNTAQSGPRVQARSQRCPVLQSCLGVHLAWVSLRPSCRLKFCLLLYTLSLYQERTRGDVGAALHPLQASNQTLLGVVHLERLVNDSPCGGQVKHFTCTGAPKLLVRPKCLDKVLSVFRDGGDVIGGAACDLGERRGIGMGLEQNAGLFLGIVNMAEGARSILDCRNG
jgi:hypothetical protein